MTITSAPTIDELTQAWELAKHAENQAKQVRLEVERQLLEKTDLKAALIPEGTSTFGRLKVVTGYTRDWDQQRLAEIQRGIEPNFWPFKAKLEEIRAGSRFLEEERPDLWAQISPALTLKPKKPAFTVKGY
ncbi:hypothetical protein [Magnetofaba australis]|uniref:Uncharacterized protein n=1 Tax=Magnetofaba australis IT-1 TaxID=1434232 RepID=A0A1Y2K468_9PROT|nr:hypothetical protein [Magnetofaba australis]OSM04168.1 hypothetical protein MAIT1_04019 [Magnetofaba australis IT-1]